MKLAQGMVAREEVAYMDQPRSILSVKVVGFAAKHLPVPAWTSDNTNRPHVVKDVLTDEAGIFFGQFFQVARLHVRNWLTIHCDSKPGAPEAASTISN